VAQEILHPAICLLGLLLAVSLGLFQRPIYRARTSLAIQDLNENFLNLKEDPTAINPAGPAESYFQTQVQILQSDSLLQRVIENPTIAGALAPEQSSNQRWHWRKYLRLAVPNSSGDPQRTIERVASRLTVRSSGETRLVQVFFESEDPKVAADFANTLVNEFVEQSHQMRWESTERTAEWLAAHLSEIKTNLENGEAQLQIYISNPHHHFLRQCSSSRNRTGTQFIPGRGMRSGLPNSSRRRESSRFFRCSYKSTSGATGGARWKSRCLVAMPSFALRRRPRSG